MAAISSTQLTTPSKDSFNLCEDVLLEIFSFCATMDAPSEALMPGIDTLRYISQVCPTWRQLTLSSPSFWGRVINLNRFLGCSQEWLDEVIRRAGSSTLCVCVKAQGEIGATQAEDNFIKAFFSKHWRRTISLDAVSAHDPNSSIYNASGSGWLPVLSKFPSDIRSFKITSTVEPSSLLPIHCNCLEALEISGVPNNLVSFFHPWGPVGPLFESQVVFPLLKRLKFKMYSAFSICITLSMLDQISPNNNCLLHFNCAASKANTAWNMAEGSMPFLLPKYPKCAESYFASMTDLFANVIISNATIAFSVSLTNPLSDVEEMCFTLKDREESLPPALFSIFLASFENFRFDNVRKLSIIIHDNQDIATAALQQFLSTFSSIEALEVSGPTFLHSVKIFGKPAGFFSAPSLKHITIHQSGCLTAEQIDQVPRLLNGQPQARVHPTEEDLSRDYIGELMRDAPVVA